MKQHKTHALMIRVDVLLCLAATPHLALAQAYGVAKKQIRGLIPKAHTVFHRGFSEQ
jgi:hypothetical protein